MVGQKILWSEVDADVNAILGSGKGELAVGVRVVAEEIHS
jgi:hypothetical protein